MQTEIQVIVTGTIRSDLEARMIFHELICAQRSGLIKRIIYTSWEDHLKERAELTRWLSQNGIDVLGTPPLKPNASIMDFQFVPFYTALQLFEDDEIVLRLRTDKCFPLLKTFLSNIYELKNRILQTNEHSILDARIAISQLSIIEPFAHADFMMMSKAKVFRKVLCFDRYFDYFCKDIYEGQWFARPFIQEYSDIRLLFENITRLDLTKSVHQWAKSDAKDPMPEPLIGAISRYLDVCRRHFVLISDYKLSEDLTLVQAMAGLDPLSWNWGARSFISSNQWLSRFQKGEKCGPFSDYLREFAQGKGPKQTLFLKDIENIRQFINQQLSTTTQPVWHGSWIAKATPTQGGDYSKTKFDEIIYEVIAQIHPNIDKNLIENVINAISHYFDQYPTHTYYEFGNLLEEAGKYTCKVLEQKYQDLPPRESLLIPAVLFSAALSFSWKNDAGIWLAESLLAEKIPTYFGPVTRWGINAKVKHSPPYQMFLAGMLLIKGIGGEVKTEDGIQLISLAANNGNHQAKIMLEQLGSVDI